MSCQLSSQSGHLPYKHMMSAPGLKAEARKQKSRYLSKKETGMYMPNSHNLSSYLPTNKPQNMNDVSSIPEQKEREGDSF